MLLQFDDPEAGLVRAGTAAYEAYNITQALLRETTQTMARLGGVDPGGMKEFSQALSGLLVHGRMMMDMVDWARLINPANTLAVIS